MKFIEHHICNLLELINWIPLTFSILICVHDTMLNMEQHCGLRELFLLYLLSQTNQHQPAPTCKKYKYQSIDSFIGLPSQGM